MKMILVWDSATEKIVFGSRFNDSGKYYLKHFLKWEIFDHLTSRFSDGQSLPSKIVRSVLNWSDRLDFKEYVHAFIDNQDEIDELNERLKADSILLFVTVADIDDKFIPS